uniref:Ovule protein n=1 Tax=Romanomermis culicivorax TaxID=13658 RepID=A0A915IF91_ROMCU
MFIETIQQNSIMHNFSIKLQFKLKFLEKNIGWEARLLPSTFKKIVVTCVPTAGCRWNRDSLHTATYGCN